MERRDDPRFDKPASYDAMVEAARDAARAARAAGADHTTIRRSAWRAADEARGFKHPAPPVEHQRVEDPVKARIDREEATRE